MEKRTNLNYCSECISPKLSKFEKKNSLGSNENFSDTSDSFSQTTNSFESDDLLDDIEKKIYKKMNNFLAKDIEKKNKNYNVTETADIPYNMSTENSYSDIDDSSSINSSSITNSSDDSSIFILI